jgi:hypothetical protein
VGYIVFKLMEQINLCWQMNNSQIQDQVGVDIYDKCHLIIVHSGPTRRCSRPPSAHEITAILAIVCNALAAAKRQSVGPRGVVSALVACLDINGHAACSVPAAAPARMPTQTDRRRSMP